MNFVIFSGSRNRKAGLIAIISFLVLTVVGLGIAVVLIQVDLKDPRDLNPEIDRQNQNNPPRSSQPPKTSPKPHDHKPRDPKPNNKPNECIDEDQYDGGYWLNDDDDDDHDDDRDDGDDGDGDDDDDDDDDVAVVVGVGDGGGGGGFGGGVRAVMVG